MISWTEAKIRVAEGRSEQIEVSELVSEEWRA